MKDKNIRKYGYFGIIRILYYTINTRFFFRRARLIRLPIDIRGRTYINFGSQLTTGKYCRLEAYPVDGKSVVLNFGKNVQINDYVHITAMVGVTVGDNVLMASKIYISDCTHGSYKGDNRDSDPEQIPIDREYSMSPVVIGDNVWIGESVSILPGVKIGKGSIIGANSVVTKSIPEYCIAVGIPATVIKKYNFKKKVWEEIKNTFQE